MTYIVKIPRTEVDEMSECAEAILCAAGKLMSCIKKMNHSELDERSRMGMHENYLYPMDERSRMGMRDERDYDMREGYDPMDERRGRDSSGRYVRR